MFTGIIEEVGRIGAVERHDDSMRIHVRCSTVVADAHLGDSIAVNGVCLTVSDHDSDGFYADVMQVTVDYTTLGSLSEGDPVNLERAMAASGRFGGHVVQGHVDGVATVVGREPSEHWEVLRISLDDPGFGRYLAKKGSVAVNGTSLTIAELEDNEFQVSLIPTTLADTMLGTVAVGDKVNIECDVLAKYVERHMAIIDQNNEN